MSRDVERDSRGLREAGPEGTSVREGAKRLVGPRPEGPCELTGDELGAAVSEGSTRQGSVWSLGRRQCLEGNSRATQTHVGRKLLPAWPGEAA